MKKLIRSIIFCLILVLLLSNLERLFTFPPTGWEVGVGLESIHKYPNQYDVCFFGSSHMIANISNQELYNKYGIAGISVAGPEQKSNYLKYMIEETLRFQKPKAVILEAKSIIYTKETETNNANGRVDYIVHAALDGIKSVDIKRRALERVKQVNPDIDEWDFYSAIYYNHSNWDKLTKADFEEYPLTSNGNTIANTMAWMSVPAPFDDSVEPAAIPEMGLQDLKEIVALCKENGADLILMTSYIKYDSGAEHKAMENLAAQYGIKYVDINSAIAEGKVNFNYATDTWDGSHFNLCGAVKCTEYIGQYLSENYAISDKRNDSVYARYEEGRKDFQEHKRMMNDTATLATAVTLNEYLDALSKIDREQNLILICVYDEASGCLTEENQQFLEALGLKTDIRGYYRSSYAAVIDGLIIKEEFSPDKTISIEGKSENVSYNVTSGGLISIAAGGTAFITVNGRDIMQHGRGFNIAVYNKYSKSVISSVFFDTCGVVNPSACKIVTTSRAETQIAVGPNMFSPAA